MRSVSIADWILRQVAGKERAVSPLGREEILTRLLELNRQRARE
jgi:hypothetical protein